MRANQPLTCGFVAWDADCVGSCLRPAATRSAPSINRLHRVATDRSLRSGLRRFLAGGSQALALAVAQGGVEMVFDEPGRYPLVNHVMIDTERGAHGVIEVTR